jgi:hypothetical protein
MEIHMTTATITQAQDKGLRHQFDSIGSVSGFCRGLWTAFGGKLGTEELAVRFEAYSPSLAAELRTLDKRA